MPKTKTTAPKLTEVELKAVYEYVLRNWAVGRGDIETATGLDRSVVGNALRIMEGSLINSTHVNSERELTYQTNYDVENDKQAVRKGLKDFRTFAASLDEARFSVTRNGATGPKYTESQIKKAIKLRKSGATWKDVAASVGVKSPAYFSMTVQAVNGSDPKAA